ncbi:MAG: transport system ATP-binding/permease protein, partial [Subtercola sp.]|nr:transport system ATP-binding/permease protein [Subtercola sp.]
GKDVVDLENVSVVYEGNGSGTTPEKRVLHDVTWRIAPGERTGVLGVNGAGKSTLLSLVAGSLQPTTGTVKRGKTIRVATLTQQLFELDDILNDRVSEVIGRQRSSYVSGGKEMTPTQLLERVGFTSAQLSTPVKDLSGGQKRRLQLLLILLSEPNVLILDEPTNDLDTDMLAALEDLLDTYPGTLLVVSHDRYLLERVTDNQYAVIDGGFIHLPRGVDQYLEVRALQQRTGSRGSTSSPTESQAAPAGGSGSAPNAPSKPKLSGADLRNAQKELASVNRRLEKYGTQVQGIHEKMATHDASDYAGLGALSAELDTVQSTLTDLELRWLELSELLA